MWKILPIKWNSIGFKLVTGVYFILLPLIVILVFNNYYAVNVIHNQVAESYSKMMDLYMSQIDQGLVDADKYIYKIIALDTDFTIMEYSTNRDQFILSKANLSRKMTEDISMYKAVDFMFVYSDSKDKKIEAFKDGSNSYNDRENVRNYIRSIMKSNVSKDALMVKGWYAQKINGEYYILRILRVNDTYVGAWVKPQNLIVPLNLINIGEQGTSLLTTGNGIPMVSSNATRYDQVDLNGDLGKYYLTGDKKQFLVVGQKSSIGDYKLIALIPNKNILENLPVLQRMIRIIVVLVILILPMFFLFFRKIILKPLSRLLKAIKQVRDGNLDVSISDNEASDEFKTVNATFNKMVTEIKQLRIDVYEEQLNKQKAELEHLQLQVKPHFFLNSLNIIYNLAQVQNYKLIQEMTLCLVNYFRYMFKSNLSFVALKSEMEHVRNYIRIQEMRYPNSLECSIEIPDTLHDVLVPPLIIQTFVENTVKHAVTLDEPVHVAIKAEEINTSPKPYLKITICDNGSGFQQDILKEINLGNRIIDEQGEHIGIWNAQRRIRLLYKGDASIAFRNWKGDTGAMIEIMLPMDSQDLIGRE